MKLNLVFKFFLLPHMLGAPSKKILVNNIKIITAFTNINYLTIRFVSLKQKQFKQA